jgi:DNA-binding NtrC family response regulator
LEELPALIAGQLELWSAAEGKEITEIHPEAMEKLLRHPWPGNLRELSHTVRTMALFCDGKVILPDHVVFPPDLEAHVPNGENNNHLQNPAATTNYAHNSNGVDLSLAGAVQRHVRFVYDQANRNQRRTAKLLGISRATLARHLKIAAQK